MSIVINTNTAASLAANNLNTSNTALQKSLAKLSSGSKIVTPADDAGGLAVSLRMQAAIKRTDAATNNVSNAVSYLQTQDGALSTAAKVLDRISELATMYSDVTKSTTDKANYDKELNALTTQLTAIEGNTFNDVDLFTDGGSTLSVGTSEDGSQTQNVTVADLKSAISSVTGLTTLAATDTVSTVSTAIDSVAALRAQNGAEQSNLGYASDLLTTNRTNLESANSRIVDVDVASESTQLAKENILVSSGATMLAQANSSAQTALKLLQS
jgi:flagellin